MSFFYSYSQLPLPLSRWQHDDAPYVLMAFLVFEFAMGMANPSMDALQVVVMNENFLINHFALKHKIWLLLLTDNNVHTFSHASLTSKFKNRSCKMDFSPLSFPALNDPLWVHYHRCRLLCWFLPSSGHFSLHRLVANRRLFLLLWCKWQFLLPKTNENIEVVCFSLQWDPLCWIWCWREKDTMQVNFKVIDAKYIELLNLDIFLATFQKSLNSNQFA